MVKVLKKLRKARCRKEEQEIKEELIMYMNELNELILDAILTYDQALDMLREMEGDE